MERRPFQLSNGDGDPIRGDVWVGEPSSSHTAILICHGFKGFKDWGFFPYAAEQLVARTGHPVVTFNFSLNGVGADMENFTELDKFERNTFSQELDDTAAVLDAAQGGGLPGLAPCQRFGLLGHSRGGISAVITAAEDSRVSCLVTWSAVAYADRWSAEQRSEWRRKGRIEILNSRTGQRLPLGVALLEDTERNAERLDVLGAASRLRVPYLVVHGTDDESVSVADGVRLAEAGPSQTTRLQLIEGGGHTFGAVHPFQGTTEHLTRVVELTAAWFSDNLAS
ncbi:MAG: alpha/beta fold hydrolase [Gemmatimonadales bacterium]|jgi:pimeloyl-ACP methyl ester carboxylesterase